MTNDDVTRLGFVALYFRAIEAKNVPYALLRNLEDISSGTEKDIDLVVDAGSFGELLRLARECCATAGADIIYSRVSFGGLEITVAFLSRLEIRPIRFHFVPFVSLHTSAAHRRIRGYSRRVRIDDFQTETVTAGDLVVRMPAPHWRLVFTLQRLLRKPKEKYTQEALTLIADDASLSADVIAKVREAVESGDKDKVSKALRLVFDAAEPSFKPAHAVSEWIALTGRALKSSLTRKGLIVIFSGPDGAGKSTSTDICVDYLREEAGLPVKRVKGLTLGRGRFGSRLLKVQHRVRGLPEGVSPAAGEMEYRDREPSSRKGLWKLRRGLGLVIYIMQYFPSYMLARIENHRGVTFVVDTSVQDRFVKAHRPRFPWIERWVAPMLPTGDVLFQLYADPELIHARKPELTVAEIEAYYASMKGLLAGKSSVMRINTDSGVEVASHELRSKLVRLLVSLN